MKKILKLVLGLLLIGSMAFGATESAQVIISTKVGETPANSGIRVVHSYAGTAATEFDAAFYSADSVLSLASGKDTSAEPATGQFVVLVRRPVTNTVNVSISGAPMALVGGTGIIPTIHYSILGTEASPIAYIDYTATMPVVSGTYTTGPAVDGIIRDAKAFTYEIPVSASAPLGTYSATITFSITVE